MCLGRTYGSTMLRMFAVCAVIGLIGGLLLALIAK